jgi:hypothetical protein
MKVTSYSTQTYPMLNIDFGTLLTTIFVVVDESTVINLVPLEPNIWAGLKTCSLFPLKSFLAVWKRKIIALYFPK